MKRGYARVSTIDQDLGRQVEALKGAGCEVVYQDKESGKNESRQELDIMLEEMESGDIIIVCKLDRLGRSLSHLLKMLEGFKAKGVGFKSLGDPIDTTTAAGVFFFQIMGAVAEFERQLIVERIKSGLAHKKRQGVVLGRPMQDLSGDLLELDGLSRDGLSRDEIMQAKGWSMYKYYKVKGWKSKAGE